MEDCLPQNFADKLIELQSMLDEAFSMDLIQQLNELYRIGIDYYVRTEPRKALHFQKKMTSLLSNPKTLNIIEKPQSQNINLNFALDTKIKDEVLKFKNYSDAYINNILQSSQKALKRSEHLKNIDLNKQQKQLQERIMLKKVRSQQKLNMKSPRKFDIKSSNQKQSHLTLTLKQQATLK